MRACGEPLIPQIGYNRCPNDIPLTWIKIQGRCDNAMAARAAIVGSLAVWLMISTGLPGSIAVLLTYARIHSVRKYATINQMEMPL